MAEFNAHETLDEIRKRSALVHHLTNWVTINDCAQIVRHWGSLPVMAHAKEEVEEMVGLAGALVLNIGTLTPEFIEAMLLAAKAANDKRIPVVMDAVGVGATKLRTDEAARLMRDARIDVVKGNAGEVATLAGLQAEVRGVESMSVGGDIASAAAELAKKKRCVVAVTGEKDIVTDGRRIFRASYGHPMMGLVVGTGCMAASTIGCFLTAGDDRLVLTAQALACYGIAGERAAQDASGPGDFIPALMNSIYSLSTDPGGLVVEIDEAKSSFKGRPLFKGFYFITDSKLTEKNITADVKQALDANVSMVQYREKEKIANLRRGEAEVVLNMCRGAGVPMVVNDDVELAKIIGADGVHLGKADMPLKEARDSLGPEAIIGVSVSSAEEARAAEEEGADYVAVSPVFETPTKPDAGASLGIETIEKVRDAVSIPVIAIGGLNGDNIKDALKAGADLVCAISASLKGGTVKENIKAMMKE